MNLKNSLTVRLSEEQFKFLSTTAEALEVTPSKVIRMIVNSIMVASKRGMEAVAKGVEDENIEANKYDKL